VETRIRQCRVPNSPTVEAALRRTGTWVPLAFLVRGLICTLRLDSGGDVATLCSQFAFIEGSWYVWCQNLDHVVVQDEDVVVVVSADEQEPKFYLTFSAIYLA
jgi:hypothetical protein